MRVAVVTESFFPLVNGVTNSVARVLENLRANGHEAIVICASHPKGVPSHYAGYPVMTLASVSMPFYHSINVTMPSVSRVQRILEDFQPDVVHVASPFLLGNQGIVAAARLSIPSVVIYQTDIPNYLTSYGFPFLVPAAWVRVRRMHNYATMTLAPSTFTRQQLLDHGITRVDLWGRGVDTVRFHPDKRDQALHDSWAPNGERVVGYAGRLGSEKQVGDLAVLADLADIKVVIVGDGPERASLQKHMPNALFVGQKTGDDLPRHLASFDIFVHTGELETFGQTIQEAHASGLPVIAPGKGGPLDLVDSSRDGWLYEPGNLDQLRNYVMDLAGDNAKRAIFSETARSRIENHTWASVCDELFEHYREAIRIGAHTAREISMH